MDIRKKFRESEEEYSIISTKTNGKVDNIYYKEGIRLFQGGLNSEEKSILRIHRNILKKDKENKIEKLVTTIILKGRESPMVK